MIGLASPAQAYTFIGCKFDGTNPEIDIESYTLAGYTQPLENAVDAWNTENVPGHFDLSPGSASIEVKITQWSSIEDYWGSTPGADDCPYAKGTGNSHVYSNKVEMYLNDATMASLSGPQRRLVIIHELGHAYGLWHMPVGCGQTKAVMQQTATKWTCNWSGNAPWADDVDGVKARY